MSIRYRGVISNNGMRDEIPILLGIIEKVFDTLLTSKTIEKIKETESY